MTSPSTSLRARKPSATRARVSSANKSHDSAQSDPRAAISPPVKRILDEFRLEEIPSHLLRRAHFAAEELFAQEFAAEGLTPRQKATLVILYQHPGLNQNALADRLFMDRNTVAEMAKRLAANGLISRMPAPEDQRAYCLFLAPDGVALINRVMPRDRSVEDKILERLPPEYHALFLKCLRLIVDPPGPGA
ncbi:MarR family winged helix-turn-helix transcriptional regulator [Methylibium petroleiphilum]|uniref:MarR family winged helix-turn-helix transcriptional regulator n=1 Tax=Methylibium petroleiphilum TaxID=105560 RepID=UPI003D2BD7C4